MKKFFDWFLGALLAAVLLASLYPKIGARGGPLHPEITNKLGVALIFFLHGTGLSFHALRAGTLHWRLHLVVQLCTFAVFPALGAMIFWVGQSWLEPDLRLGVYFLCALPSTVSSSVAMTAAAKGNVPAALFNATISSLLGVVLTPLWVGLVTRGGSTPIAFGPVVLDLCRWLVLPLVIGQLVRPVLGSWAHRNKSRINVVDRCTIVFLVYSSFCDSVKEGVWSSNGVSTLLLLAATSATLFAGVMIISGGLGKLFGFSEEDRISTMFCASKKSLATGIPMAQLMFAHSTSLGLIVLPILIYHSLQLIVAGVLAGRWSHRVASGSGK